MACWDFRLESSTASSRSGQTHLINHDTFRPRFSDVSDLPSTSHDPPCLIDAYIARFPPEVQELLHEVRQVISKAAPHATEAIKYRMPTFVLGSNLVHFAGFARHIGFYPTPSAMEAFEDELKPYKRSKGSVQFPLNRPIPLELIRRMVEFRVREISC